MSIERELLDIIGEPDKALWDGLHYQLGINGKRLWEIIDSYEQDMWSDLYNELEECTENKYAGDIFSPEQSLILNSLKTRMLHLFLSVAEGNVMKKKYTVRWTQTLQEDFEVEAESEEQAIEMVRNGECGDVDNIADNDFEIIKTMED